MDLVRLLFLLLAQGLLEATRLTISLSAVAVAVAVKKVAVEVLGGTGMQQMPRLLQVITR
jgi:hypothetical protein